MTTQLDIRIGDSAWLVDPNDPDVYADAIVGGVVLESGTDVDEETGEGCEWLFVVRVSRGQLRPNRIRADRVVSVSPADRGMARDVYRSLCQEVAGSKRHSSEQLRRLRWAVLACEIAEGLRP